MEVISLPRHTIQIDSHNCGVYVVYFAKQIAEGKPLTDPHEISQYRFKLQELLLYSADKIQDLCVICGLEKSCKPVETCAYCKRFFHLECTILLNHVCQICDNYISSCTKNIKS